MLAKESRERKKEYIEQLEKEVEWLQNEVRILESQIKINEYKSHLNFTNETPNQLPFKEDVYAHFDDQDRKDA